jgi:16S rRNA (adenine1518-N6/adenine1519-N6)-dimethyltransferase
VNSIRKVLALHDIRPRKRLGQSFLEDRNMIHRIAALVEATPDETVVEIGAGLGLLTAELAERARKVVALEIDPRLVAVLRDRFSADETVEIVAGDVMDYDFSAADSTGRIKVVGNIPYNISTPILFRLLDFRRSIASIVLMLQKELADRILANPGKKDYGIPSVIIRHYASVSRELTIPPTCFYPEPAVFSSVLRIVTHSDSEAVEDSSFVAIVRASFAQRRKTLVNNLRAAGFSSDVIEEALANAGISGARRAETLTVDEFRLLAAELSSRAMAEK